MAYGLDMYSQTSTSYLNKRLAVQSISRPAYATASSRFGSSIPKYGASSSTMKSVNKMAEFDTGYVESKKRSTLDRIFDAISIGQYVVQGNISAVTDKDPSTNVINNTIKAIKSANPFGDDYTEGEYTFSDNLRNVFGEPKTTVGKVANFVAGLAGDVLLDPTTYMSLGLGAVVKGTGTVGVKGLTAIDDFVKVGKNVPLVVADKMEALKHLQDTGFVFDDAFVKTAKKNFRKEAYDGLMKEAITSANKYQIKKLNTTEIATILGQAGLDVTEANIKSYSKQVNKLAGINTSDGVGFGINLPGYKKSFISEDSLRFLGDKTIAPFVRSATDFVKESRIIKLVDKQHAFRKLAQSEPETLLKKLVAIDIAKGKTKSFLDSSAAIREIADKYLTLDPDENTELLNLLEDVNAYGKELINVDIDDYIQGRAIKAKINSQIAYIDKKIQTVDKFNKYKEEEYVTKVEAKSVSDEVDALNEKINKLNKKKEVEISKLNKIKAERKARVYRSLDKLPKQDGQLFDGVAREIAELNNMKAEFEHILATLDDKLTNKPLDETKVIGERVSIDVADDVQEEIIQKEMPSELDKNLDITANKPVIKVMDKAGIIASQARAAVSDNLAKKAYLPYGTSYSSRTRLIYEPGSIPKPIISIDDYVDETKSASDFMKVEGSRLPRGTSVEALTKLHDSINSKSSVVELQEATNTIAKIVNNHPVLKFEFKDTPLSRTLPEYKIKSFIREYTGMLNGEKHALSLREFITRSDKYKEGYDISMDILDMRGMGWEALEKFKPVRKLEKDLEKEIAESKDLTPEGLEKLREKQSELVKLRRIRNKEFTEHKNALRYLLVDEERRLLAMTEESADKGRKMSSYYKREGRKYYAEISTRHNELKSKINAEIATKDEIVEFNAIDGKYKELKAKYREAKEIENLADDYEKNKWITEEEIKSIAGEKTPTRRVLTEEAVDEIIEKLNIDVDMVNYDDVISDLAKRFSADIDVADYNSWLTENGRKVDQFEAPRKKIKPKKYVSNYEGGVDLNGDDIVFLHKWVKQYNILKEQYDLFMSTYNQNQGKVLDFYDTVIEEADRAKMFKFEREMASIKNGIMTTIKTRLIPNAKDNDTIISTLHYLKKNGFSLSDAKKVSEFLETKSPLQRANDVGQKTAEEYELEMGKMFFGDKTFEQLTPDEQYFLEGIVRKAIEKGNVIATSNYNPIKNLKIKDLTKKISDVDTELIKTMRRMDSINSGYWLTPDVHKLKVTKPEQKVDTLKEYEKLEKKIAGYDKKILKTQEDVDKKLNRVSDLTERYETYKRLTWKPHNIKPKEELIRLRNEAQQAIEEKRVSDYYKGTMSVGQHAKLFKRLSEERFFDADMEAKYGAIAKMFKDDMFAARVSEELKFGNEAYVPHIVKDKYKALFYTKEEANELSSYIGLGKEKFNQHAIERKFKGSIATYKASWDQGKKFAIVNGEKVMLPRDLFEENLSTLYTKRMLLSNKLVADVENHRRIVDLVGSRINFYDEIQEGNKRVVSTRDLYRFNNYYVTDDGNVLLKSKAKIHQEGANKLVKERDDDVLIDLTAPSDEADVFVNIITGEKGSMSTAKNILDQISAINPDYDPIKDAFFTIEDDMMDMLPQYVISELSERFYSVPEIVVKELNHTSKYQVSEGFRSFLDTYDKFLHMWKMNVTVVNPGYHIRNVIGNGFNSYLGVGKATFDINHRKLVASVVSGKEGSITTKTGEVISYSKIRSYAEDLKVANTNIYGLDLRSMSEHEGVAASWSKFNPLDSTEFLPYRIGTKAGAITETHDRYLNFIHHLQEGETPAEAARLTKEFLFDYTNSTMFEQEVMRRLVPFWSWMKNNLPLQAEQMIDHPEKFLPFAKIRNAMNSSVPEEDRADRNYVNDFAFDWWQLPGKVINEEGREEILMFNPNLPYQDISIRPSRLIHSITPFIKVPYEILTNRHSFYNQPIYNSVGEAPLKIVDHLASQLTQYNTGKSVINKSGNDRMLEILAYFTAIRVMSYDAEKYKYMTIMEELKKLE